MSPLGKVWRQDHAFAGIADELRDLMGEASIGNADSFDNVFSATNLIALLPPNDSEDNSPIKVPLTENCRPCAILVVLCAGILM
jgi:hypothetical protein